MTILRPIPAVTASLSLVILAGCAPADNPPNVASSGIPSTTARSTTYPPTTTTTATPPPVTTTIPAPPPIPKGPRPTSGKVLTRQGASGRGSLAVDNGTPMDAVLTLAREGRPLRVMYVRASENATLSGIADGIYELYYTSGTGWNVDLRIFTSEASYFKFDDPVQFTTTRVKNGIQYTRYRASLHEVPNGQATKTPVSADAYPR